MLALQQKPAEAYRRSEFDARIGSARTPDLVCLCVDQVVRGLGSAIHAHGKDDRIRRSEGLTLAVAALTALEMGIDRNAPLSGALLQLYGAARATILQSVTRFDGKALGTVRADFGEIGRAFAAAQAPPPART